MSTPYDESKPQKESSALCFRVGNKDWDMPISVHAGIN